MHAPNEFSYQEYQLTIEDTDFMFYTEPTTVLENQSNDSPIHFHEMHELMFSLKGNLKIKTDNHIISLHSGDGLLIPKNTSHKTTFNGQVYRIAIAFSFKRNRKKVKYSYYDRFVSLTENGVLLLQQFTGGDAFKRFAHYYFSNHQDKDQLLLSCFYEIIILVKSALVPEQSVQSERKNSDMDSYRNYLTDYYFSVHFANGSLRELAQFLHLSQQQTGRIIKKRFGQTFSQRMISIKMQYARNLLRETDLSISSISEKLGYVCTHSFHTAFQAYYGMTPGKYRNQSKRCENI